MRASTKGKAPTEMGTGGGERPAPGRYHVAVKSVDDSHTKHRTTIPVEFEVLAGSVPGQERKTTIEFFYYDPAKPADWAIERLTRFAWACGLLGEDEEKDVNLQHAVGRQLCVELYEDTYVDKNGKERKSAKINGGDMWPVTHPDVADIPKDQQALGLLSGAAQAQAFAAAPAQQAVPAGSTDPLDGLL